MDMVRKHPDEEKLYTADFSRELGTSESITLVTSVTAYEAGEASSDLTINTPTLSNPYVQVLVTGGEHGHLYVLRFLAVSSGGQDLVVSAGVSVHR